MSSWRQISVAGAEQTLKALEKHELYELACDVVRERVDEFQMDKVSCRHSLALSVD